MKSHILEINNQLNEVHTVLSKLTMKEDRHISDSELLEIENAEELLNKLRTKLVQIAYAANKVS